MIAISVDVFAATKSSGAADASTVQESSSFLEQYKRKIGSFGLILHLTSRSCRCGFCATSFITRCCIRLCRIKCCRHAGGEFTLRNSIGASANSLITGGRDGGEEEKRTVFLASSR